MKIVAKSVNTDPIAAPQSGITARCFACGEFPHLGGPNAVILTMSTTGGRYTMCATCINEVKKELDEGSMQLPTISAPPPSLLATFEGDEPETVSERRVSVVPVSGKVEP